MIYLLSIKSEKMFYTQPSFTPDVESELEGFASMFCRLEGESLIGEIKVLGDDIELLRRYKFLRVGEELIKDVIL